VGQVVINEEELLELMAPILLETVIATKEKMLILHIHEKAVVVVDVAGGATEERKEGEAGVGLLAMEVAAEVEVMAETGTPGIAIATTAAAVIETATIAEVTILTQMLPPHRMAEETTDLIKI
jgi:hypothetical protein